MPSWALSVEVVASFPEFSPTLDALTDAQVSVSVLHVGSDRDQVGRLEGLKTLIMGAKD